jgi:hypothetical protein
MYNLFNALYKTYLNSPYFKSYDKIDNKKHIQVQQHEAYAKLPVTDEAVRYLLVLCNMHFALPLQSCLQAGMPNYIPWKGTKAHIIST